MDETDAARRAGVAARAAREAGVLADEFGDYEVATKTRPTDYVTEADHAAQDRVLDRLADAYPGEPVVGEEEGTDPRLRETVPGEGPAWVVDPIDGTGNYVRGLATWCCAVACVVDREPVAAAVAAPELGRTYVGDAEETRREGATVVVSDVTDPSRGAVAPVYTWRPGGRDAFASGIEAALHRFNNVQRVGSAQATLAAVADGGLAGAFSSVDLLPWDAVAGVHLVRRAGGRVTGVDGERWTVDSPGLVASNGVDVVHDALLECAAAAGPSAE